MFFEHAIRYASRFCGTPLLAALTVAVALLVGCSDNSSDRALPPVAPPAPPDTLAGFVNFDPVGDSVYLGADVASAPVGDRPRMLVKLNYAFSLSRSEVTCGEYKSLMSGGYVPA